MASTKVTLIPGDGVGKEIVQSVQSIFKAAHVEIDWEVCEAGAEVFKKGIASGVTPETIASIERTRVVLKGPLETPVGYGEKSANVTLRKLFETYANVRPVKELPGVKTPFSGRNIDLVVVRENIEDLYAGIEHMQTPGVAQCLKLITRKGCEKIIRFAFELARAEGRKKVHCATKANIMKLTEGMFKRTFEDIAKDYSDIKAEHIIIDNCAHMLVRTPEQFDVLVMTNMNGDIISDLTSGLVGGLGFAPSANIGNGIGMFEAVHGSAPTIAGKNIANPTALLSSAVMMLRYLNLFEKAELIENALLKTLEEGSAKTADFSDQPHGTVSTTQFTDIVVKNLGQKPTNAAGAMRRNYQVMKMPQVGKSQVMVKCSSRRWQGVDLFLECEEWTPQALGENIEKLLHGLPVKVKMLSNRGTQVYPVPSSVPDLADQWRCRLMGTQDEFTDALLVDVLKRVSTAKGYRWAHIEKLQYFDDKPGYTKAQGED